jgi:hypothetical protein
VNENLSGRTRYGAGGTTPDEYGKGGGQEVKRGVATTRLSSLSRDQLRPPSTHKGEYMPLPKVIYLNEKELGFTHEKQGVFDKKYYSQEVIGDLKSEVKNICNKLYGVPFEKINKIFDDVLNEQ